MADFELVSRRVLSKTQHRLFRHHYLLGADWKLCTRRTGISRGKFFHAIYRIEELLGRAFYELRPYALYPPRDYFTVHSPIPVQSAKRAWPGAAEAAGGARPARGGRRLLA